MATAGKRLTEGRSKAGTAVAVAVGVAVGLGGGVWAGMTLLTPSSDVLESPGFTLVSARSGVVGQSLQLNASAQWKASRVLDGAASGMVTTRDVPDGERVIAGDLLYTVDLRPVVVGEGSVPSFRDLSLGDSGDDVAQLQRLLAAKGYYVDEPSGRFTPGTRWAVQAWQSELGVEPDGTVRRGDIIYVPSLPSRVALAPSFDVGSQVGSTDPAVHVLPTAPQFWVDLAENQSSMVSRGDRVSLTMGEESWQAVVQEVKPGSDADPPRAVLEPVEGESAICADGCDAIPLGAPTRVDAVVETVPEVEGVTVPAAAIVTKADGTTGVQVTSGDFHEVDVVASASGMAVVDGLDDGMKVRTPGEEP